MGLVILSVFALMLAGCGSSDSGDNSGSTATPGTPPSTAQVPLSISVEQEPATYAGGRGVVHEGQTVDLSGIVVVVRYNDTWKRVKDPLAFTVSPAIYDWRVQAGLHPTAPTVDNVTGEQGYVIKYKEGYSQAEVTVPASKLGIHRRLLDLNYTGSMKKQEYLIDEFPDFSGITFEGEYSDTDTWYGSGSVAGTQSTHYHKAIPLSLAVLEYEWRWVWNNSQYASDNPGVLIKIGSFGNLRSPVDINDSVLDPSQYDQVPYLTGRRIPVTAIYQVSSLDFVQAPTYSTKIFFDDPSLIGLDASLNRWVNEVFQDIELAVKYYGTSETRTYPVRDILDMTGGWNWSRTNEPVPDGENEEIIGAAGLWSSLAMSPIDAEGIPILRDVRTPTWGTAIWGDKITDQDVIDQNIIQAWSQWAFLKQPRIRFYHRGLTQDTVVPIYTKLESVTATARDGQTPVLNGGSLVHKKPDGIAEFIAMLKISATYSRTGNAGDTATRDDLKADQDNGTLRYYYQTGDLPNMLIVDSSNVVPGTDGILTESNSLDYLNKGKLQKANITFTATDDYNPRARSTTIQVGVINYVD